MAEWRELGNVMGLQIQRSSLKLGERLQRRFDPAPLLPVETLWITADGAAGDADGDVLDVHNARHPATKNVHGINDISIGFTAGYALMRNRFGAVVTDGIAGENILVASATLPTLDELAGGLALRAPDGACIEFGDVSVAHPCVEFSRFVLGDPQAAPALVAETLIFLDNGTRGYYATVRLTEPWRVVLGATLLARR